MGERNAAAALTSAGIDPPIVGFAVGVFDMFHVGHLNIIRRAASLCDQLVVGIKTDELVTAQKGRAPVVPFDERCEIVAALRDVHAVTPLPDLDFVAAWDHVRYQRMFAGDDHRGEERWQRYEAELATRGAEVVYFPYTTNTSSTLLRDRLMDLPTLV